MPLKDHGGEQNRPAAQISWVEPSSSLGGVSRLLHSAGLYPGLVQLASASSVVLNYFNLEMFSSPTFGVLPVLGVSCWICACLWLVAGVCGNYQCAECAAFCGCLRLTRCLRQFVVVCANGCKA